jgi:hypothetical protein
LHIKDDMREVLLDCKIGISIGSVKAEGEHHEFYAYFNSNDDKLFGRRFMKPNESRKVKLYTAHTYSQKGKFKYSKKYKIPYTIKYEIPLQAKLSIYYINCTPKRANT